MQEDYHLNNSQAPLHRLRSPMASTMNLGLEDGLFDTHHEPLGKQENSTYFHAKQANFEEPSQHYLPLKKQDIDFSRQSLVPGLQENSSQGIIQAPSNENDASLAPPFK